MHVIIDILLLIPFMVVHIVETLVKTLIPRSWRAKSVGDDIVLITGGASGIGQQMAYRFAKLGATVVIWDINRIGMAETERQISEIGGKSFSFECDVGNREEVYEVARKVKTQVGIVSILINNAGIVTGTHLLEAPDRLIQKTFDVNILAHFWTVKAFLPDMIKEGKGHIVTTASLGGQVGMTKLVDYCASKYAAVGFDESLQLELRSIGAKSIVTTVVCPYHITTGMFEGWQNRLIPSLTPEYVADEAVTGILANERMLIVPRHLFVAIIMKTLLPWKTYLYSIENILQTTRAMAGFRGRQPVKQD